MYTFILTPLKLNIYHVSQVQSLEKNDCIDRVHVGKEKYSNNNSLI